MQVYIFGVGTGREIVQGCIKNNVKICGYIDNNADLQGKKIDGRKIVSPDGIHKYYDFIIVSVQEYEEIYQQLLKAGIARRKVFCFWSLKHAVLSEGIVCLSRQKYRKIIWDFYAAKINQSVNPFNRAVNKWFRLQGDCTYRLDYALDCSSVVFDLGGYHGDFTQSIVDKFDCNVWVFEPVPEYASLIKEKFKGNPKVKVFCMGLADKDADEMLYMNEDGSSVYARSGGAKIPIKYCSVSRFLKANRINNIDLMKINIEGGEYSLLEHMIKTGEIRKIDNLQVQFHNIKGMQAGRRMRRIWKGLKNTHRVTWKFRPYVWENWERKAVKKQI